MTSRTRDFQLQLVEGPVPEEVAEPTRQPASRGDQFRIDRRTRSRGLRGVAAARAILAQVPPPADWVDHSINLHKAS